MLEACTSGWVNELGATCLAVGGGLWDGVENTGILCMRFCSNVVLEYSRLHRSYIATKICFLAHFFYFEAVEKTNRSQA